MEYRRKIILIVAASVALIILALTMVWGSFSRQTLSPNILSLTQPVYAITGTVADVKNKNIILTLKQTGATQSKETGIAYSVAISNKTVFNRQLLPLDYGQKTKNETGLATSLQDVRKGDIITVQSKNDLRLVAGNSFEADNIILPSVQKMISGTVLNVTPSEITLQANVSAPSVNGPADLALAPSSLRTYTVRVTPSSRLVKNTIGTGLSPGQFSQQVTLDSLRPNMTVSIYLDKDVRDTPLTMLYGEYSESTGTTVPATDFSPLPPVTVPTGSPSSVLPPKP